jgi:hypothetical protein
METEHRWQDVHGRIGTNNSSGVYYTYYSDGAGANRLSQQAPGYKARLDVMASSSRKVLVTLNFYAMPAPGKSASALDVQTAKDLLVDQVNAVWNQKKLKIVILVLDGHGRPNGVSRRLDVEFRIRWTASIGSADYALCVYPSPEDLPKAPPPRIDRPAFVMPAAGATSGRIEMHISGGSAAWIYSHEFGHCIGLPDEYSHPGVSYLKPGRDGLFLQRPGSAIPENRRGRVTAHGRDPDLRTEMSTHQTTSLLPRHLWPTAIEVRRLLNLHAKHTKYGLDVVFP